MSPRETILNQLMTIKYGSVNNFFSITAKDPKGALLQASKYFYEFAKKGYIRAVEYDITPRNKRKEIFYYPTAKGAKYVGREEEYKYKEVRAFSTVRHDSMKFDIALSLIRLYPPFICLESSFVGKSRGGDRFYFDPHACLSIHKGRGLTRGKLSFQKSTFS